MMLEQNLNDGVSVKTSILLLWSLGLLFKVKSVFCNRTFSSPGFVLPDGFLVTKLGYLGESGVGVIVRFWLFRSLFIPFKD